MTWVDPRPLETVPDNVFVVNDCMDTAVIACTEADMKISWLSWGHRKEADQGVPPPAQATFQDVTHRLTE